jgi:predicted dehydrogenase
MAGDPVRVGVVGCGWWATTAHLPALRDHACAELTAVADPDEAKRADAVARFGARHAFADADAMLDAVALDAVVVATPHVHHVAPAAAVLSRGVHVLVEKPLTIDPGDARELVALAETRGVELIVGYPWHYTDFAIALRRAIEAGRIGTIEHVSCTFASIARELYRGTPEGAADTGYGDAETSPGHGTYSDPAIAGGGQGQTQLTHSAALTLFLTGLRVVDVRAFTASFELAVDLADALAVRFDNGAVGTFDAVGSVQPGQDELLEIRIFGSEGHVAVEAVQGRASIHGPGARVETLPQPAEPDRYPVRAPVHNLVDVARGAAANGSPGTLGLQVVALVDAMYRTARAS